MILSIMKASVFFRSIFLISVFVGLIRQDCFAESTLLKSENLKMLPDWIKKPDLLKAIDENRKILVSVLESNHLWTFKGAGKIEVERSQIIKSMTDIQTYRAVQLIKEAHFSDSVLKLKLQLGKREIPIDILLKTSESQDSSSVLFEVKNGFLKGYSGEALLFDLISDQRTGTFIYYQATFHDKNHKVPTWFATILVEGIMQRMAALLRENLEQKYQAKGTR